MAGVPETLYVATSNPGKLRDFAAASGLAGIKLLALPGLDKIEPPIEDADSFTGNAVLKAIAYSLAAPGKLVLADDSGLEVDALNGAPGVYSARYAARAGFPKDGILSQDAHNNAYLLHELESIPLAQRTARYRCVLAVARNGALEHGHALGSGTVEGLILAEPRGTGGFGYDPLFFLPARNQTMAEISLEEKFKFSHRGRALTNLLELRS
jgi:XTP/dITP diphosphohydrolase